MAGELVFFISSQIINSIVDLLAETIASIYVEFIKNTPCGCDPDYEEPLTYLESLLMERLIDIGIADYLNEDGSLMFTLPNLSDILELNNIDTSASVRILIKNSLFIFIIPEDYNS